MNPLAGQTAASPAAPARPRWRHDLDDIWLTPPPAPWPSARPEPDLDTAEYFAGLRRHWLMIARCTRPSCRRWIHAPLPACPTCHCREITAERVSGAATIWSYSVVCREFMTGLVPPYVAALVELVEQRGLRLLTNIVDCRIGDIGTGLPVEARFSDYAEHTMLYFRPISEAQGDGR